MKTLDQVKSEINNTSNGYPQAVSRFRTMDNEKFVSVRKYNNLGDLNYSIFSMSIERNTYKVYTDYSKFIQAVKRHLKNQ